LLFPGHPSLLALGRLLQGLHDRRVAERGDVAEFAAVGDMGENLGAFPAVRRLGPAVSDR
jgi:hypothetical protein